MEPTPQAMRIARKYIRDIEVLNGIRFGNQSWQLISQMLGEIEGMWDKIVDRAEREALESKKKSE